jgi:hypothetical protein
VTSETCFVTETADQGYEIHFRCPLNVEPSRRYFLHDHNATRYSFLDILQSEIDQDLFPVSQNISDNVKLHKEEKKN